MLMNVDIGYVQQKQKLYWVSSIQLYTDAPEPWLGEGRQLACAQ